MTFKCQNGKDVELNKRTFKQILRGGIQGSGLVQVEFKDGTIEWLKATDGEILKAATED
jgi:hypothetical protein